MQYLDYEHDKCRIRTPVWVNLFHPLTVHSAFCQGDHLDKNCYGQPKGLPSSACSHEYCNSIGGGIHKVVKRTQVK